ncbi:hypothetical protein FHS76_001246 [Ochrobactrum daejeonense]|uniref:Uncharacterized protein n=1 Tax=Brucella daejeonensis TaxID=659015 RepID=A0A7W9AVK4_9HYPH|nr:hypothetical protein [Brucella daejeonensis]MBB5701395.1 hypothetical protein [Brucella daejeonensis]
MKFGKNRSNWTFSLFAAEKLGRWAGYKLDPIQEANGRTLYVAGIIQPNGRVAANTKIGLGHTPEFAIRELLRNNGIVVDHDRETAKNRPSLLEIFRP